MNEKRDAEILVVNQRARKVVAESISQRPVTLREEKRAIGAIAFYIEPVDRCLSVSICVEIVVPKFDHNRLSVQWRYHKNWKAYRYGSYQVKEGVFADEKLKITLIDVIGMMLRDIEDAKEGAKRNEIVAGNRLKFLENMRQNIPQGFKEDYSFAGHLDLSSPDVKATVSQGLIEMKIYIEDEQFSPVFVKGLLEKIADLVREKQSVLKLP